ncbi:hypothetical protein Y032_0003g1373 [Ancylostoma ceylanicum]|uniref:Uncharacterized protein n=1 Tax=Ancylostoma ceylanicum TaxID=53326 RepID=A0A016VXN8_9BILA|nr:hypothetical protein Y032_0003g1373 [Ancylostoma ceylanicum]
MPCDDVTTGQYRMMINFDRKLRFCCWESVLSRASSERLLLSASLENHLSSALRSSAPAEASDFTDLCL